MATSGSCEENDVLVAAALWLVARGFQIKRLSPAGGKGIDSDESKSQIASAFEREGLHLSPNEFVRDGADIVAQSDSELWQVECKGYQNGNTTQTHRNNFDRALASVVSYYIENQSDLSVPRRRKSREELLVELRHLDDVPTQAHQRTCYLALSLPATEDYVRELRRRVCKPLRRCLKLWILLYDPPTKTIQPVSPEEDYPA